MSNTNTCKLTVPRDGANDRNNEKKRLKPRAECKRMRQVKRVLKQPTRPNTRKHIRQSTAD